MKSRVMRTDYPIRKIADDTYMISDFGIANCYLLIGEERALLIDCGLGIGDIKGAVEKNHRQANFGCRDARTRRPRGRRRTV